MQHSAQRVETRRTGAPRAVRQWGIGAGWVVTGASGAGALVSGYLTYVHFSGAEALCIGVSGCEVVNASRYAAVFGVPVALLGLFMYLALLGLGLLWAWGPSEAATGAMLAIFGVSLAGVLFAGWLTYVELFILGAICSWCVLSAVLISGIFLVAVVQVWRLTAS